MRHVPSAVNRRCLTGCVAIAATTPGVKPWRRSSTTAALETFGVPPEGGAIYELALTHRSYAFERREPSGHNERLEFLGDAILEAVVTELIYGSYPELAEGEMARLRASVVNTASLAEVAAASGLGKHVLLGRGEESSGGRTKPSILANVLEALVGAVYLDRGLEGVREALTPIFRDLIDRSLGTGRRYDVKTALQEVVIKRAGVQPLYRVSSTGPDHDKRFDAQVFIDGVLYGDGGGRSKKQAEYVAAAEALVRLEREAEGEPASARGEAAVRERGAGARAS